MFEIIVFTLITIFLALYSQFLYSRRRIYEDDMIFFVISTQLSNSMDMYINKETKITCQLTASLSLLVNLQF